MPRKMMNTSATYLNTSRTGPDFKNLDRIEIPKWGKEIKIQLK